MKRDMELCRKIMFKIEDEYYASEIMGFQIDGYSNEEIIYHCKLLLDASLIQNVSSDILGNINVGGLTWEGHDFLDKIREDSVWNKTKEIIKSRGLPMIIDVIKEIASAVVSSMTEGAIKAMKP